MSDLFPKDSVALVTGAGSGIGRATAIAFAREGVRVVACDISEANAAATVATITAASGTAIAVTADVSDEASVKALVDKTVETFGRLDYAFNNAGVNIEFTGTYEVDTFDRTMAINARGVFLAIKYQVAAMQTQGKGAIVNTSSMHGIVANPMQPGYVASKHAVVGLTQQAALRYGAEGIRVNAVCPGIIHTAMIDRPETGGLAQLEHYAQMGSALRRIGKPEEIAEAVLWLSSDKASYVTGHALLVDGGFTAA